MLIRVFPGKFIHFRSYADLNIAKEIVPRELFIYCDVYLLIIFIIMIIFFIGMDFLNSMASITLVSGGLRINKFMLRKIIVILLVYISLYIITYTNIYTIFLSIIGKEATLIPIWFSIKISLVSNIFIIALSLFLLFLTREVSVSIIIVVSYYFIEEYLWRCKITQGAGLLSHLYYYYDYSQSSTICYFIAAWILLIATYFLAQRENNPFKKLS